MSARNTPQRRPHSQTRRTERLVFPPASAHSLQRGIKLITDAIRPTLGPNIRTVAVSQALASKTPELLDKGGLIARRISSLPDRDADMGAMLLRQMLWQLYEQTGDGTATAAILFESVYGGGRKYLAAGGNAMRLRFHLEKALPQLLAALDGMTFHISGKDQLAQAAQAICHDPPLAKLLGEIFDVIGAYGQLDIRKGRGRELQREYIEGMAWKSGLFSREMIENHAELQTVYETPALLILDFQVNDPRHIMPMLEIAVEKKIEQLILVAADLSPAALAGLLMANGKLKNFRVMAVKGPGMNTDDRFAAIEDLSILTGAVPLLKAAGHSLKDVAWENFGWARRGWASPHNFGIIGGRGNPRKLRRHVSSLQAQLQNSSDPQQREKLVQRIGKLMGGSAALWIGGASELEIDRRKELAQHTARALREAVKAGVLPGGGSAMLGCRAALQQRLHSSDPDERAACRILHQALTEPARAIFENAGYDPSEIIARLSTASQPSGFDVITGQLADINHTLDSAAVQKAALKNAVLTAGMVLTVDVLVHHRRPEIAKHPG